MQHHAVIARGIAHGVIAEPRADPVGIIAAEADQTVITQPAVDAVGNRIETVDRVIAAGLGDVDIVLEQLER